MSICDYYRKDGKKLPSNKGDICLFQYEFRYTDSQSLLAHFYSLIWQAMKRYLYHVGPKKSVYIKSFLSVGSRDWKSM